MMSPTVVLFHFPPSDTPERTADDGEKHIADVKTVHGSVIELAMLGGASGVGLNIMELHGKAITRFVMNRIDKLVTSPLSFIKDYPGTFSGIISVGLGAFCIDKKEKGSNGISWSCSW